MASAHAADDLTRPIRVSPDGHFLAQSDAQPFFWLGDTGWLIFTRLTQYLKSLMLSRPYFTRIPDQTIVVGATGQGTAHIGATRDKAGSYAMIFLPHGQPVAIDMSKISGARALGWWFDPRTGIATPLKGTLRTAGVRTFTPPECGAERDWVLVLDDERSRFPAPGLRTGG